MKTVQTVKTSFARYADANVEVATGHILSSMDGNPNFPGPIPVIAQITSAAEVYHNALLAAQSRAPQDIRVKNDARRTLTQLLKELGLYIIAAAKGDVIMMSTTGFPLSKVPSPRTTTNPGPVTLRRGNSSGKMEALIKPEKPSPGYLFQITNSDPALGEVSWNSHGSTVNKFVFTGLVRGSQYWVRAVAIGPRGQQVTGPYSSDIAV